MKRPLLPHVVCWRSHCCRPIHTRILDKREYRGYMYGQQRSRKSCARSSFPPTLTRRRDPDERLPATRVQRRSDGEGALTACDTFSCSGPACGVCSR